MSKEKDIKAIKSIMDTTESLIVKGILNAVVGAMIEENEEALFIHTAKFVATRVEEINKVKARLN